MWRRYTKALENIKALRKDRMAELKAEKERMEGLSREKGHSDKLKGRINELQTTISEKEVHREEVKTQLDAVAEANRKLDVTANAFRRTYEQYNNLENALRKLEEDLKDIKLDVKELDCKSRAVTTSNNYLTYVFLEIRTRS